MNTLITDKHNQRNTGFLACVHSLERLCYLLFLLTSPLCWGEVNTPTRDYRMIDLKNGLATEMLEIGKTSFTFSVQWPLDREIEMGHLKLIGKLDIEERGWHELNGLYLDSAHIPQSWTVSEPAELDPIHKRAQIDHIQGKAIFEIFYAEIPWYYTEWSKEAFEKKAFYAVRVPVIDDSPYGPAKGKYEEDDETDVMEGWWERGIEGIPNNAETEEGKEGELTPPSQTKGKGPKADGAVAGQGEAVSPTSRVWLYASIFLVALCAVFYVVRRKKS